MAMNLQRTIFFCALVSFLMIVTGCGKSPQPNIGKALAATNSVFQTWRQEPIPLTTGQNAKLKQIIARFNDPKAVQVRREFLPAQSGTFLIGEINFYWLGSLIYLYDSKTKLYYVVQDAGLIPMADAFNKVQGSSQPLKDRSREEWQEILSSLEASK